MSSLSLHKDWKPLKKLSTLMIGNITSSHSFVYKNLIDLQPKSMPIVTFHFTRTESHWKVFCPHDWKHHSKGMVSSRLVHITKNSYFSLHKDWKPLPCVLKLTHFTTWNSNISNVKIRIRFVGRILPNEELDDNRHRRLSRRQFSTK